MMGKREDLSKKRLMDIGLVIIVLAMAVLVYFQLSRLFDDVRGKFQPTESTGQTGVIPDPTPSTVTLDESPPVQAPDFELATLEGDRVSLSEHRGKAVMINFWTTWCPPCRAELPLIESYAMQHADQLVVLAVNAGEEQPTVERFVSEFAYNLVFLLDPSNDLASAFMVRGLPTSIFIDEMGLIQARHIGLLDESLLRQYLSQVGVIE